MQYLKILLESIIITMGYKKSDDDLGDSINIRLPKAIREKLEFEAKSQGIYMSQLIRKILMDYVNYLGKRDNGDFVISETTPQYQSLEEVFTSDEFRELLRKEVQLALKKLIQ